MVNEEGYTKRGDREISIRLGGSSTDAFFGRSVSPEAIIETMGRELTEEELENNVNHYTKDYFLCTSCENRLSKIEDYYATNSNKAQVNGNIKLNKVKASIGILFWASILWRISVTKFTRFKGVTPKEEKKLRNILDLCLGNSIEETKQNTVANLNLLSNLNTLILVQEEILEPSAQFCFIFPEHRFPYTFIINNYVIFFYLKASHFNGLRQDAFGYEKFMKRKLLNNSKEQKEKVLIIPQDFPKKANELLSLTLINYRIKLIENKVSTFIKRTGLQFPPNMVQALKSEVIRKIHEREDENFKVVDGVPNKILAEVLREVFGQFFSKT
ncbi:MAG: hypothetical protein ACO1OF_13990 [Adhaeribacter sp.]